MKKFLAIIPARYASSRFEGKPLAEIFGIPMVVRVYRRATEVFDDVYIATDDERIQKVAESNGCRVVMTSTTHRSGTDRCREALETVEKATGETFDVVVNVQGDEPFIHPDQLRQLTEVFVSSETPVEIATLVKPFSQEESIFDSNSPKVVFDRNMNALYFSRSAIPFVRGEQGQKWQSIKHFYKHIGLYAYRTDILRAVTELPEGDLERCESLEQLRWLENGFRIKCAVTNFKTIAIDTPEDLKKVLETMRANV